MDKIEFKITLERLHTINNVLRFSFDVRPITRQEKVAISVLDNVIKKLAKKEIDKARNTTPFKISLKYYEAYYLESALLYIIQYQPDNDIQIIIDILNQQLV